MISLAGSCEVGSDGRVKPNNQQDSIAKSLRRQRSPLEPFVLIPKIFFVRYNPSWKAVLAYTTLLYYSNTTSGSCENVTMKTMAQRVGVGWQTFLRGLEALKRKGIVKVPHRSKESLKGGRVPLANLYELVDLQPDAGEPI